jgi:prevent-host-death family protein
MSPDREIAQRELRNDIGAILREVEAGARLRVTVRGRPVADLVPVERRRTFLPRSEVLEMIGEAPLDARFRGDVREAIDETLDE